jgi:hypothetical protein
VKPFTLTLTYTNAYGKVSFTEKELKRKIRTAVLTAVSAYE